MGATTMLRTLAVLSAFTLVTACSDTLSPAPSVPSSSHGGGLAVVPRAATIQAGQGVLLKATLSDDNGDAINGQEIRWSSNNQAVATVSSTGEVVGRSAGHAVIAASAQGRSENAFIKVTGKPSKPAPEGEN
jgi:uncharacterized protein YjdB